jgi:hypothetical protein
MFEIMKLPVPTPSCSIAWFADGRIWLSPVQIVVAALLLLACPALAREPLSDAQVRHAIIQDSIAWYQATGHPCACPYNPARNGKQCGRRSAYSRPGGAEPYCFPQDVSDGMVADWRRRRAR